MTRKQVHKQLQLIHKDLTSVETRMNKISAKLGIGENHQYLEQTLYEIKTLMEMFKDKEVES